MAQAFTNVRLAGLTWTVQESKNSVLVQVQGATERNGVKRLEILCKELLGAGKELRLDMRNVSYIDSILLALLAHISRHSDGKLQIIPGEELLQRIRREDLKPPLPLIEMEGAESEETP